MTKRVYASTALFSAFLLTWLGACSGGSSRSPSFVPAAQSEAALRSVLGFDAATVGTAVITIVIPAHPASSEKPAYVSPATAGIGVDVSVAGSNKSATKFFFALTPSETYCSGGAATTPLTCRISAKVPAGKDTFAVTAYAGSSLKSPALSTGTLAHTVPKNGKTAVNVSMGGIVASVQVALEDPFPASGKKTTVPVNLTVADAWGYEIIGTYSVPIAATDSDASGVTKLSAASLTSSAAAAKLTLSYGGNKLLKPATITLRAGTGKKAPIANASFMPGGKGVVGSPALAFTSYGIGGTIVQLGGPGTTAPYALTTEADVRHDRACAGFVTVSGSGSSFVVSASGSLGACWLAASDSAGHKGSVPVLVSSFQWPPAATNPTPPAIPTTAPFVVATNQPVPAVTAPPAGHTPQPISIPVVTTNGRTVVLNLKTASGATIPSGITLTSILSNTPLANVPAPQMRRGAPKPHAAATFNTLLYLELLYSGNITLADQPALTFTLPSNNIVANATYWSALYDSTRPQLGWQLGFEGPGVVNGSTITFTGNGTAFYFQQFQPYIFALYAQSVQAALPTPPPTPIPPTAPPTPGATPSPTPSPGFGVTPALLAFTAAAQTSSLTTTSGNAPYSAFTSDATVVTVSPVFGNGPFTATAVAAGSATITLADSSGNTTLIPVTVTTTTIPITVGAAQ